MQVKISDQLALFLASFICGCVLSVFYDLIRMTRMWVGVDYGGLNLPKREELHPPLLKSKANKIRSVARGRALDVLVLCGDVLFFIVAAFAMLCVFFNYGGKVRGSAIFVAACGFLACHFTVGEAVMRIFGLIRLAGGIALEYVAFFAMWPVRRLLLPVLRRVAMSVIGVIRIVYLRIYTKRTEEKLLGELCGLREERFEG